MPIEDQARDVGMKIRALIAKAQQILKLANAVVWAVDGITLTTAQKQAIMQRYIARKAEMDAIYTTLP